MEETKRCPYCGEEILAIAKKCKHCKEWLQEERPPISLEQKSGIAETISTLEKVVSLKEEKKNGNNVSAIRNENPFPQNNTAAHFNESPKTTSVDEISDSLVCELNEIEKEVMNNIELLSQTIDESYGQIAQIVYETATTVADVMQKAGSRRGNEKLLNRGNKIAIAGALAAGVINGIGEYKKQTKRNEWLDKLMEKKQEIAAVKLPYMKSLNEKSAKVSTTFMKILDAACKKRYPTEILQNPIQGNLIKDTLLKKLNLARSAYYYSLITSYLLEEYQAWNKGIQTSGIARPTMLKINEEIMKTYEVITSIEKIEKEDPLEIPATAIIGLSDDALTSMFIFKRRCDRSYNAAYYANLSMYGLLIPKEIIANRLLESNKFYNTFEEKMHEYYTLERELSSNKKKLIWVGLFSSLLSIGLSPLIPLLIIGVFYYLWSKFKKEIGNKKTACQKETFNILLKTSGYEDEQKINYEKKDPLAAALGFK